LFPPYLTVIVFDAFGDYALAETGAADIGFDLITGTVDLDVYSTGFAVRGRPAAIFASISATIFGSNFTSSA
jgi:hypothetical protein